MVKAAQPEGAKVFVIDDDRSVLRSFLRLLAAAGFEAEGYNSAREFLGRIHDGPCCVIVDLRMPEVDGLALQKALCEREGTIPVIFVSGEADVPSSVEAMKQGAVDFLTKPVNPERLLEVVQQSLARSVEMRREVREESDLRLRYSQLTPREQEVASMVAKGLLNKQIAAQLGTTEKTIKVHRARALEKLHVESVAELVRMIDRIQ